MSRWRGGIGHRHLDDEIDAARPRGERGLEDVRTVRGEHEEHVGVIGEAVELVEELEEERLRRHSGVAALLRDEVDVLDHDGGRREGTRELADGPDHAKAVTRRQQERSSRHLCREIHDREGLAGAGRSVQEHASLERASRGEELVRVRGEAYRLAFDPLSRPSGSTMSVREMRGSR